MLTAAVLVAVAVFAVSTGRSDDRADYRERVRQYEEGQADLKECRRYLGYGQNGDGSDDPCKRTMERIPSEPTP